MRHFPRLGVYASLQKTSPRDKKMRGETSSRPNCSSKWKAHCICLLFVAPLCLSFLTFGYSLPHPSPEEQTPRHRTLAFLPDFCSWKFGFSFNNVPFPKPLSFEFQSLIEADFSTPCNSWFLLVNRSPVPIPFVMSVKVFCNLSYPPLRDFVSARKGFVECEPC